MSIEPKELLLKMKDFEFVYDTKIGKAVNKKHEEDKKYVFKILDLLYANYDRVRYVDDLSDSVIGKGKWSVLISQKFAVADKRFPIPQVPFNFRCEGKTNMTMKAKHAYYMLIGFFQECEDEICVSLNFRDSENRKVFKNLVKNNKIKV